MKIISLVLVAFVGGHIIGQTIPAPHSYYLAGIAGYILGQIWYA